VQAKNDAGARAEAQRALVLMPESADAKAILDKLKP
jgi:hypothetical protein